MIRYYYAGKEIDKLYFSNISRPEITVTATDPSMNKSIETVRLVVDSPPRFYGVHDQYVFKGSSVSDLDPVFACDEVDGGISSRITSNLSSLNLNNIGDYKIKYTVTDSYGLEARAESTVHVVTSRKRVEEHKDDCILSNGDLSYAAEEGFFSSSPFAKPDRNRVIEDCGVSLVNLFVDKEDSTSSGSAFIYKVDPPYIYMVSVYHVTSELERQPVTIIFYDGTRKRVAIRSIRMSAGNEAALFRIPIKIVPYHVLVRLREVAWESDIYDRVKDGTPLIEYCKNWRGGDLSKLVKDVEVISFTLSPIQRQYVDDDSYYATTRKSVSGMSGTAVFDYRGVLAGICSKTMYPLESEEAEFRDGCDFVLMVDKLDELLARKDEL